MREIFRCYWYKKVRNEEIVQCTLINTNIIIIHTFKNSYFNFSFGKDGLRKYSEIWDIMLRILSMLLDFIRKKNKIRIMSHISDLGLSHRYLHMIVCFNLKLSLLGQSSGKLAHVTVIVILLFPGNRKFLVKP
jgi:hypothetical protein